VTTISFDEDIDLEENPWRGRIMTLLMLLGITAVLGAGIWYFYLRDDTVALTRETEEIPVTRGAINQNLSITGTADAELNSDLVFQTVGKVSSVGVKVGDTVQQDQVLASLESDDLQNAVASAQANVRSAQLKLDDLLAGTDAADVATADQAVAAARAQLTKAENDYDDLNNGGTAADLSAAQQGVRAAEAQLATAKANRQKLDDTPSSADLAAAEAGVSAAEAGVNTAQGGLGSAQNAVVSATASLKAAETSYCLDDGTPSFCTTPAAPVSGSDMAILDTALGGANATKASLVITANSGYLSAVNARNSAQGSLESAQEALVSAEERLAVAQDGPSSQDIAAADAAVLAAEAGLVAAADKYNVAEAGGTDFQRSSAAAAADSAAAALFAAESKLNQALRGAEANTVEQARQAVRSAQLQVEAAQIRLKNAQIIAPFAGTVAAVNIKPGEFFSSASAAADGAGAIVLLTPDRLTLRMTVGETDYRTLKIGQGGASVFDGLPGSVYPFTITEIGLSPTVTQGVVTYGVKASLIILPNSPRPAPGMNARGQIITDSKPDVLIIPSRAIRLRGTEQVVDVKRDAGIEEVVVTTGANDGPNVEVVTGLAEGDTIVVVTLTSGGTDAKPQAEPTLPGGVR
jgi:HlyD family secretion protein